MWGSESKQAAEGLPEERKALALRYTIDAAEAERREQLAPRTAVPPQENAGSTRSAAGETTGSRTARVGVTAPPRPRPSEHAPSLKERLANMLSGQESSAAEVRLGPRASRSQPGQVRCASCGKECVREENWTLRLCGDDQLHPVCRGCDERDFSESSGLGDSLRLRPLAE
jgi:hypothetical protein